MIFEIYENVLAKGFEELLDSIDEATESVLKLKSVQQLPEQDFVRNGMGVELQGRVIFFRDLLLEQLRQSWPGQS